MATGIPARLKKADPAMTKAESRKFGLLVGSAFLLISAFLWWRGRHTAPYIAGLGGALVLAGLLVPTLLGPVNKAWMGLAHLMSKVTTPIFMGVVYFVIFTPIALGMRLLGRRSLVHPLHDGTYWMERDPATPEPSRMKRQF